MRGLHLAGRRTLPLSKPGSGSRNLVARHYTHFARRLRARGMPASFSHTGSPTIDGPVDLVATSATSFALARCHSCKPGHANWCNANFPRMRPWLTRALALPKGRRLVTALLGGRGILWPMPPRRTGLTCILADSRTGQAFGVGTRALPRSLSKASRQIFAPTCSRTARAFQARSPKRSLAETWRGLRFLAGICAFQDQQLPTRAGTSHEIIGPRYSRRAYT
jgi:hypothetical protein